MSIYNIRPGVLLYFFSQVHSTVFEDKEEQQCDTHFKKVCWYVSSTKTRGYLLVEYILDVLWGQPIKLIQVVSTSEFHEY